MGEADIVFCEWGETYCCLAAFDKTRQALHSLKYFIFDAPGEADNIQTIVDTTKAIGEKATTFFCSAFPEAILVPKKLYNPNSGFLSSLYATEASSHADYIGEWSLVNNYAFPKAIDSAIRENFSSPSYYHVYTPALKIGSGYDASNQVTIHFAPSHFRVVVKSSGQLLLAQMYSYTAPLDVVYYLLKIFQELGLSNEETAVIISGLVDEDSGLYKELYQFVQHLHFAKKGGLQLKKDLPAHYFTSLYNLAACVS